MQRRKALKIGVYVLIGVAVLLPFVPMIIWSFSLRWFFPAILPTEWSLRPWEIAFAPRTRVLEATLNSLWIAVATTIIGVSIAIPAGRALGLSRFRGKRLVEFLILAPTLVPTLAAAFGIHVVFIRYGLADRMLGVILVHLIPTTPYAVSVLASVFSNYNPEFELQARSLGANRFQTWRHVTFPAIWAGVMVASLFVFMISWSQYLLTLLIGGGQLVTLPTLLFSVATSGDNGLTAALSLIFVAPALILISIGSRYLGGSRPIFTSTG